LSGGRADPVPGAALRPPGAVARGPAGAHAGGHPGAHAGAHGGGRLRRREPAARAARSARPRHGRRHTPRSGGAPTGPLEHRPAVLRRALEMADYERLAKECLGARREGRLLGLGVACYVELTGVGPFEGATIRADATGRITVFTGVSSQGQGLETTLAQIAADELGVTPAEVTIIGGDTLGIGQGIGTFASRAAVVGGNAVALAARELRA